MKVTHLSSAHPRDDVRIFYKECNSLNKKHSVSFVVADGKGEGKINGINIYDVGMAKNRFDRFINCAKRVYQKALEVDADIYHFHDPELIPIGLKLMKKGKIVIYDVHEDVPRQITSKTYINKYLRSSVAKIFEKYEDSSASKFNGVITATPFIRNRFAKVNKSILDINNYPILGELDSHTDWENKEASVCYVGGIYEIRGIKEIVKAFDYTLPEMKMHLAGKFYGRATEKQVKNYNSWKNVIEYGFVDRKEVKNILSKSIAGLVTLHPVINYLDSLPVKMFEYMIAGIPVIASNFPLWKEIIEGNNCGICVDPLDPKAIGEAINYLQNNRDIAQTMGENGRKAVLSNYNWEIEEQKLFKFYESILNN